MEASGEKESTAIPARAASLFKRRFSRAGRPPFFRRRLVWVFEGGTRAEAGGGDAGVGEEAPLAGFSPLSSTIRLTHSAPSWLTRLSLALQPSSRRDLNFRKKFSASFILVIVSSLMLADHYSTSFLVQQKIFFLLNASLTTL